MVVEAASINQRFQADASFQPSLSGRVVLEEGELSDDRVRDFIRVYKEEFGDELSADQRARC
jgi:hypothetical protein